LRELSFEVITTLATDLPRDQVKLALEPHAIQVRAAFDLLVVVEVVLVLQSYVRVWLQLQSALHTQSLLSLGGMLLLEEEVHLLVLVQGG